MPILVCPAVYTSPPVGPVRLISLSIYLYIYTHTYVIAALTILIAPSVPFSHMPAVYTTPPVGPVKLSGTRYRSVEQLFALIDERIDTASKTEVSIAHG